ncbi:MULTISPECIES: glycogen debranching protein GlgX [unclassified Luteococcus]|uniref:glycogen debranching protein GlgX n=1 Tax=unclassified Luteococcus TaxID=2639923 RepID=UPI00313CE542
MDELELDSLIAQLTDDFPRLTGAEVNATVREVHASTSSRIVDYIPLMVQRRSRARLAARCAPIGGGRAVTGVPPLGATVSPHGVTFCLFSRDATSVTVELFEDAEDAHPSRTIRLDPRTDRTYHYWHVHVPGLRAGQLYGYRVDGPHRPADGLLFDPDKLLVDPYALAVSFPDSYSRRAACQPGDNTGVAPKSVVVDPEAYDWEGDRPLGRDFDATFIYEMHVKGFTAQSTSGVDADARGTYHGLIQQIPYLQELGVTTVELLPVQQFDWQTAPPGRTNYWGYQPMALFAPHAQYSSRRDPLGPVEEFQDLVKALHCAGIEVILDVVFNHTSEEGVGGPVTSWRGLDNLTYYIVRTQDGLAYDDFTGTGNTFNTNETVVRRLILDCLRSWVQHLHVDGFRFDLASVLSRGQDGVPLRNPPILWDIETDPVLADTKIIAEAWDAVGLYEVATFVGDRWAVWNGAYRDTTRRFLKGDAGQAHHFADSLTGSARLFSQPDRDPLRSINFVTAHDGFTLNDLVSYDHKHNEANGEDNRDGANDNESWNCGVEGPTDDAEVEALRERQIRNFLVALMVSQGRPMMLMGDEVRRTQQGNNNAYCQDNELSWFDWQGPARHPGLLRFVQRAMHYRRGSVLFADQRFWGDPGGAAVTWHGVELGRPDFGEGSHTLAVELSHPTSTEHLHIIFNAFWEPLDFALPPLAEGYRWCRLVDTALPSPEDFAEPPHPLTDQQRYRVQSRSSVVLTATPDFEWREVQGVIARLGLGFPELPAQTVRATVEQVYAELTGPIRDFVPVLIEREARQRLRRERRQNQKTP